MINNIIISMIIAKAFRAMLVGLTHHFALLFVNSFFCSFVIAIEIMNQSTESADGGGFLNFYKPLDYISSVLSFCSIFFDM